MTSNSLTNQLQVIDTRSVCVCLVVLYKYGKRSTARELADIELDDGIRTEILWQHSDDLCRSDAVNVVEVHVDT